MTCPRVPGRVLTRAEHDSGGAESQRLSPAQGDQGQTQKKLPETEAIFANLAERDGQPLAERDSDADGPVKRLSIDCKATVKIGDYARGGKTRGDHRAADHDMGGEEKYIPFGLVEEDSGQLQVTFGSSSKTSDFIVDRLKDWWNDLPMPEQATIAHLQLKVDNGRKAVGCGPSSSNAW